MAQPKESLVVLPPPFVVVDGVDNVRRIDAFSRSPSVNIKPGLVYRGADPINITDIGKAELATLGVNTIIDIRLPDDSGTSTYSEIADMLEVYQKQPIQAFITAYADILQTNGEGFKLFFMHLRDKPNEPVLVHCSAGKDRTGVVIALLLMILGVRDEVIIADYTLSNIGLKSAMPKLEAELEANNQAYKDNPIGLKNFLGAFPETMVATLMMVREIFGGAENYCKKYMQLESADINKIRENLLSPFVFIEGVDNVRSIDAFARSSSVNIKLGLIYRGADSINITDTGKAELDKRGVDTIIDVRLPDDSATETYSEIADMLEVYEKHPLRAFIKTYADTLQTNGEGFKRFFAHLRDNPNKPVLVHCSAGKDRTGIVIALLLMILGVQDNNIIEDYALSGIGLGSAMPRLVAEFEDHNQAYQDNPKGLKNFLSAFPETMAATLVLIREVFGGAENYCKKYMGLEITDIDKIRQNVLQPLPPPFVFIDGVDNVRTVDVFAKSPFVKVKPGIIYRGADTVEITQFGKAQLLERRIETIIDVRLEHGSERETDSEVAETLEGFEKDPLKAFIVEYEEILQTNGDGFKSFFTHLRDNPNKPVLVHCSAGKDRTGVAIALLLMVLGVQHDDIIADYALSGIGLESAMPKLIEEFEALNPAYKNNPKGLVSFLSAPPEAMAATLVLIGEKFGGAENYCKQYMQLESKDMEKIRQNLCLEVPRPRPTKFSRNYNAM